VPDKESFGSARVGAVEACASAVDEYLKSHELFDLNAAHVAAI
jgi:hypothetical protein